MVATYTGEGRVLRATISGEADHHRARTIMEEPSRQIDLELPRSLTPDLEGTTFMDSSGVAVLLRTYRRLGELSGAVKVVHTLTQAGRVLRVAGLDKLMEFE